MQVVDPQCGQFPAPGTGVSGQPQQLRHLLGPVPPSGTCPAVGRISGLLDLRRRCAQQRPHHLHRDVPLGVRRRTAWR